MNRRQRRRAAALGFLAREAEEVPRKECWPLFLNHVRHLPQAPLDAPAEDKNIYLVQTHARWCHCWHTERDEDCNCGGVVERYDEPVRS
jgi:hypothetical protein